MDCFGGLLTTTWWRKSGLVHICLGLIVLYLVVCYGRLVRSEIMDCFKVLLLDFLITCLIVFADIYVLIYWKMDEMFGNYILLT